MVSYGQKGGWRLHTFCTLMLWLVLLKIRLAFMALANRLACMVLAMKCRSECSTYLIGDLFLLLAREVYKMVVLGANKERDGGLVEASPLPIPLLD
jgi:hypothetical protein